MMTKIGIGVIGLGRMGQLYGYHVGRQIDDATLIGIADIRQEVRDKFAGQISGVATYADYHDLLANPDIQGVIIATPTSTHREVVIAAAEAGKAIFCEKPTALSLSATDEMLDAVSKASVMFQVGFMRRFDKAYVEARKQIDAGVIGTPVTIRSLSRDPFRTSLEYADVNVSGGIIVDMGIHDIDVVRWMMDDDIARVYTESASLVYPELEGVGDCDNAMMTLKFAKGGVGNIEVSRTAIYGYDIQCEVVGDRGTLQIGYLRETAVNVLTKQGLNHDVVPWFPERFGDAYTAQIEHFVDCLVQDKAPNVTPEDARAALQASLAAELSRTSGQVINVADVQ